ncbi:Domain of unknown function (DUF4149) [Chthonomonas calidirosea]|uniref:TMEM205-like domain-containing protein n=1 Tax=Chthonomonas calidirosea (strain DSM 23976 / ICMP 18418 / T49) TaxID=1303518 RepID=S0EZB6_CHTCT|nr:DUF4149 domain-containing protein [Chthonomonas calidirosea]CCW35651.1 Domain of unknown function (DUF4149) [Chthonomonas calidirosea T49]CEK18632.1 Domain of unknown function (DUF4149) [Chthonomonas calidirosea]CEK18634.1 Domain of unknown function (DUF4149) [Chthonomonas calidirosea]CEK19636.1 Domain of unknown function (DUF4149) [Chthonomonas calidirosea]
MRSVWLHFWLRRAVVLLAIYWAGMLVGVSFLATLAKFQAPSLTMPVALDVGRATFHLFNRVEWGCALALLVLVFLTGKRLRFRLPLVLLLIGLLVLQTFWLLPGMDARIDLLLRGQPLPTEKLSLHQIYFYCELLKGILLFWLGCS